MSKPNYPRGWYGKPKVLMDSSSATVYGQITGYGLAGMVLGSYDPTPTAKMNT
jgi:hypothetical protein